MSGPVAYLTLHPERCDQCGRCVKACRANAITLGSSYVYVDWAACTHCDACIGACPTNAIMPGAVLAPVAAAPVTPGAANVVAIGSRAEAKTARKVAEKAAKAKGKSVTYGGKPARSVGYRKSSGAAPAAGVAGASAVTGAAAGAKNGPAAKTAWRSADTGSPAGAVSWTWADLALVLAMLLATMLGKDAVLGIHAVGLMPLAGRAIVRAAVLAVYYSVQFGVFAWLAQRHGAGLLVGFGLTSDPTRKVDSPSPSGVVSVLLVILLFAGTELVAILYGYAMKALGASQPQRLSSDLSALFGSGGVGLALSIVLVALVAPFAEEIAFRGVMMPVLGAKWGMWPAVLVTALVYAGCHFSLWLFFPTFALGIALGWLAWTRRSLWPAIALHVLYNAAAVAAGYLITR